VLTLRHKEGVRRQSISVQNARTPAMAVEVVKLAPGQVIVPSGERRG
jgi:NADH-quinone oxidoreductase subunit J